MSSDEHNTSVDTGREVANPHRSVGWLARFLVDIFYRKIEIAGLEHVPHDRPLVFVANHVNSLVDPALLLGYMPVLPRPLATSELWQIAILKPFLRWGAAIPVYRRHVEGFSREKNRHTFSRCHEVLAAGGAIVILPEGTSHNQPALVPLRTGVSRIVLQAMDRFGDLDIRIVPVGFTFEDRTRFRSDVLIEVGEAIDPAAEFELYRDHTRDAIRTLTQRIREALIELTLNFPSWEEADLIHRAAEIYQQPVPGVPPARLSDRVELRRTFIEAYQALKPEVPDEVDGVKAAVREYARELDRLRLRDELVVADYLPREVRGFILESLWRVLVYLPLGLIGILTHFLPFQAASLAARLLTKTEDRAATHKVLASMVFYPVTWILLAVAAGWWGGDWRAGLLALLALPVCGGFALRLYLRSALFWRRARAFLLLRSGRPRVVELRRRRREAAEAIRRLVDHYQGGSDMAKVRI